jgi:large subunit ribosomal protein L13
MTETTNKPINVPGATRHFTREDHERKWLLIDAKGQTVGRLATQIANLLRGKHKPTYTRHDDVGDFVVVINAKDLQFVGNDKVNKKMYYKHTGYWGHLKRRTAAEMLQMAPELVLERAVYGMINGGALKYRAMKKLKIYAGAEHPHKAQNPEPYAVTTARKSS